MNVAIYFLCLLLMVPIAGFAAFGLLIESLTHFGLWEVIKLVLSPLFDPFGRGIWFLLGLGGFAGLCTAGFLPAWRPYGLGFIAIGGCACTLYCIRVYPDSLNPGSLFLCIPGLAGVALSVYSLVRPIR